MDVKQILSQIREAVGAELQPKIDGLLKQVEAGYTDLSDDLKAANAESKERKLKLRDLTAQHEEASAKLKELETKSNDPKVAEELTALRTFKTETLKKAKDGFIAEYGKIEKHPSFEKAKDLFKLPKPEKDGKVDLTKLEDADLEHNVSKLAELNKLGLFADSQIQPSPFNAPRQTGDPETKPIKSAEGLFQVLGAGIKQYQ